MAAIVLSAGCTGPQSALDPAGAGAENLATLFWRMAAGAMVVWLAVIGLAIYAVHVEPERGRRRAGLMIIGGGAVVPTIVLTALLVHGLESMPPLLAAPPAGAMRIAVTGEQWWWRVKYRPPDGPEFELANEIRLASGEPVEFELDSRDVIHSFWIPALGGKMDMIPGRRTRLTLLPTRTGVFRGVCTEYCGASHALMAFSVVVMEKADFSRWIDSQRRPARTPSSPGAARGRDLFFASGCPACHTVSGTTARGVVGPSLTHVGSRLTLGAGTLPTRMPDFIRWIEHSEQIKPGVHMPSFSMLPREELHVLAVYLESLQ